MSKFQLKSGQIRLDLLRQKLFVEGIETDIAPSPFRVLALLLINIGKEVGQKDIIEISCGWTVCTVNDNHAAVVISRVRQVIPNRLLSIEKTANGYRWCK